MGVCYYQWIFSLHFLITFLTNVQPKQVFNSANINILFSVIEVFLQNSRGGNKPPKKYPMSEAECILYKVLLRYL